MQPSFHVTGCSAVLCQHMAVTHIQRGRAERAPSQSGSTARRGCPRAYLGRLRSRGRVDTEPDRRFRMTNQPSSCHQRPKLLARAARMPAAAPDEPCCSMRREGREREQFRPADTGADAVQYRCRCRCRCRYRCSKFEAGIALQGRRDSRILSPSRARCRLPSTRACRTRGRRGRPPALCHSFAWPPAFRCVGRPPPTTLCTGRGGRWLRHERWVPWVV